MGSVTDKNSDADSRGDERVIAGHLQDPNRRRFSRNALAGSAVLLSLGNRSAWSQDKYLGCMSIATLDSFNPETGMFVSAPGGRPDHNEKLAAEIHQISFPHENDYIGTGTGSDGLTYSTCQDPESLDGVCIVKGDDCPS